MEDQVQFDHSCEDVPTQHVFELEPAEPYRLDLTAWVLRRRPQNRIDQWNGAYRRALMIDGRALSIEVAQRPGTPSLQVSVLTPGQVSAHDRLAIREQVGPLLGTGVDLRPFYGLVDDDPDLGGLKDRFLGVHPTRFPSLFESVVNAIANQQLSLEVGIELLNRFAERFGARPRDEHGLVAFPEPEAVLGASLADLRVLGFSDRKANYILGCADAIATGALRKQTLEEADSGRAREILLSVRGIGPWSADYILLRGLGRLDIYPADDVGARNKLQALLSLELPPSRDEIVAITKRWQPWSGMAYFHLLLDGLAQRGCLDD
ncbi:DNA-3-methyladenine glycosylase family protein [Aquihabitans daechungensis]|uniref:DNA-3-methyladenine glycosylase family protein n=1 Tax=Aquihabitans daechungensis TaxID=1052257 RepID=UPI003B9FA628